MTTLMYAGLAIILSLMAVIGFWSFIFGLANGDWLQAVFGVFLLGLLSFLLRKRT